MNGRTLLTLAGAVALGALAWRTGGWKGMAFLGSGVVFWFMLYYTRLMTILKRANERPVGYVGSAVMLNSKLKPKLALLHVVALTRSLGAQRSPPNVQPEVYRWTDPGDSYVDAEFKQGRLVQWQLVRPAQPDAAATAPLPAAAPGPALVADGTTSAPTPTL